MLESARVEKRARMGSSSPMISAICSSSGWPSAILLVLHKHDQASLALLGVVAAGGVPVVPATDARIIAKVLAA